MKQASKRVLENTVNFFNGLEHEVDFDPGLEKKLFTVNPQTHFASKGLFFGAVNRALRKYCISLQSTLIMLKRYNLIHGLIGFWWNFENKLYDYAMQTAEHFEENTKLETNQRNGVILNEIYFQIVRLGYQNWSEYILNFKFVSDEFLTTLKLIEEEPATYPFTDGKFISNTIHLLDEIKCNKDTFEESLALMYYVSASLKLFIKHKNLYPETIKQELNYCSILADALPVYCTYSKIFDQTKQKLKDSLNSVEKRIDGIKRSSADVTVFDSVEYQVLMKMYYACNPENYISDFIPVQIKQISDIFRKKTIDPFTTLPRIVLDQLKNKIYPIYKLLDEIMINNIEHRRKFAMMFCEKFLSNRLFVDLRTLFLQSDELAIKALWEMSKFIPDYVTLISDCFYKQHKRSIDRYVSQQREEELNREISQINYYVDNIFDHDQLMVLTRSSLYLPHQSDDQLLSRARGMIEMAHEPKKMNVSIRELFDIVPHVKDRENLFHSIGKFIQSQLLSKIEPNIELEQSLLNSIGQYAEYEYIQPLKTIVKDFAKRFDFWNEIESRIDHPPGVKIMVLPSSTWIKILKQNVIKVFSEFSSIKKAVEREYSQKYKKRQLIWMDPDSLVECTGRLKGMDRNLLFLFNGTQYAIVKSFETKEFQSFDELKAAAATDDAIEQISTLVTSGLLKYNERTSKYTLTETLSPQVHRNFALKYTSAENMAMKLLKQQDIEKSVAACIVKILKEGNKLDSAQIIKEVKRRTMQVFSVHDDIIREQIRDMEIKKFIKADPKSDKYVYNPE